MTQRPPPHRNYGKTATTHVKDASGLWRVHDGKRANPDGTSETVIDPATGKAMEHLSYDDARRMKDFAVTKLKLRQAGVVSESPIAEAPPPAPRPQVAPPAPVPRTAKVGATLASSAALRGPFAGEGNPSGAADDSLELDLPDLPAIKPSQPPPPKPIILKSTDKPNPDPQLEQFRQSALAAARPAAIEAQQRADKIKAERDRLRALGIDPDAPPKPPVDPNHPKTPIVGLDDIDALPAEDENVDGGEDLEEVTSTGAKAQKDDAERAKIQAEADDIAAEGKGKKLFQQEREVPPAQLTAAWNALSKEERAEFRWRALNESDVRVGDIVAYVHEDTYPADHALAGRHRGEYAQVVRVFDRWLVNLQLEVALEFDAEGNPVVPLRGTASGRTLLNVKRDGAAPNTWDIIV